jgi:hypothetical protein
MSHGMSQGRRPMTMNTLQHMSGVLNENFTGLAHNNRETWPNALTENSY